jgi:hypothetical protein
VWHGDGSPMVLVDYLYWTPTLDSVPSGTLASSALLSWRALLSFVLDVRNCPLWLLISAPFTTLALDEAHSSPHFRV